MRWWIVTKRPAILDHFPKATQEVLQKTKVIHGVPRELHLICRVVTLILGKALADSRGHLPSRDKQAKSSWLHGVWLSQLDGCVNNVLVHVVDRMGLILAMTCL